MLLNSCQKFREIVCPSPAVVSIDDVQIPSCLGGRRKRYLTQNSEISKRNFPALCM